MMETYALKKNREINRNKPSSGELAFRFDALPLPLRDDIGGTRRVGGAVGFEIARRRNGMG